MPGSIVGLGLGCFLAYRARGIKAGPVTFGGLRGLFLPGHGGTVPWR